MKTIIITLSLLALCLAAPPVQLYQSDFAAGTYIINTPGTYVIMEDIVFDVFLPEMAASGPYANAAYQLGFFAAIAIGADSVTLDLNGHTISQSRRNQYQQRFFALIELASAPFANGKGPHNFNAGTTFIPATNVLIKNGVLGRSSHHSFHGNECSNVEIRNVIMKDFEVAGIHVNGGRNILLNQCEIGPSIQDVFVKGTYSGAIFIQNYVRALAEDGDICEAGGAFVKIRGEDISAHDVFEDLIESIDTTLVNILAERYHEVDPIFINHSGLPDGSALYGAVFHRRNPAIGPFNAISWDDNSFNSGIELRNVQIHDLIARVTEAPGFAKDNEAKAPFTEPQSDPRASIFRATFNQDQEGYYRPNAFGNAQLLVAKYASCFTNNKAQFLARGHRSTDTTRNTISQTLLNWAACAMNCDAVYEKRYVCNGDDMAHTNKGLIGIRLSAAQNVKLNNVQITNLKSYAPWASRLCGNYQAGVSFTNTVPGYGGNDVRGITIESCTGVNFFGNQNKIKGAESTTGKVIGVDVMFDSDNVTGTLTVQDLEGSDWRHLPSFFNEIPSSVPFTTASLISSQSSTDLHVTTIDQP